MLEILIARRQLLVLGLLCLLTPSALAQAPVSLTVLPNTVTAGSSCTGIVALNAPAKAAVNITLACNISSATVPAKVTVGVGKQSAEFQVSTATNARTAIATLTASAGADSVQGFFMVQGPAAPPLPGYAGITFSPMVALSGQRITGTISFTNPLLDPLVFNLTSSNTNFTVSSSVTAAAGSKSVTFGVTADPNATTGEVGIHATLAPGAYFNDWTGSMSTVGSFAFLAGTGVPAYYSAGLWVGTPKQLDSGNNFNFFIPMLKTYPDGRFCVGTVAFVDDGNYIDYGANSGPYAAVGHAGYNGQISLELLDAIDYGSVFPLGNSSSTNNYLYDDSTLTFLSDGKTARLNVIAQEYMWTLTTDPMIVFGNKVTLGTYTFTRVQ